MADDEYPRVASLAYRIVSDETHDYAKQAELDGELQGFQFGLRQRLAQFTPQVRFATEEEARAVLEPQLRAWELDALLTHGAGTLQFKFVSAHVQRAPPRPGVIEVSGVASMSIVGMPARLTLTHNTHPASPQGLAGYEGGPPIWNLAAVAAQSQGDGSNT